MAAIQRTRISSSIGGAFVVAVSAALLVGGTGGYVMRAVTSHGSEPAQSGASRAAAASEDIAQSDLTRAQPPAAAVPDWVQRYTSSDVNSSFKTDEFIRMLEDSAASQGVAPSAWTGQDAAMALARQAKNEALLGDESGAAVVGDAAAGPLQFTR